MGRNGGLVGYEATPSTPFNVVDVSTFNQNYQLKWSDTTGVPSAYRSTSSMLYRKVTVLAPVTVRSFTVNSNQGCVTSGEFTLADLLYPTRFPWPTLVTLYDMSGNQYVLNSTTASDVTIGSVSSYIEQGDGKNWTWYYDTIYCDYTLQPGDYWWPVFVQYHLTTGKTQYGYYNGVDGDLMAMQYASDPTTFATNVYLQTSNRPYLKITDSSGNDWIV